MIAISKTTRAFLGAAAISAALLSLAAPAGAVDFKQYPSAVAGDAADMMAKFGGVVIDVETKFPGDRRALNFLGCGVTKHDDKSLPADERPYYFTKCGSNLAFEHLIKYKSGGTELGGVEPGEPPFVFESGPLQPAGSGQ